MSDKEILDIFYNSIVKEAKTGKIDAFFHMNIYFNLNVENVNISHVDDTPDSILIPTFKITDKYLFDDLLIKYVNKAVEVYNPSDFAFLEDVSLIYPNQDSEKLKNTYKIKYIIGCLLANASFSDFSSPIDFLNSRIEMLDNRFLDGNLVDLGYLNSIKARLFISDEVCPIKAETPYRLTGYLEFDDGYKLMLPEIYAGACRDKYQIYAIQKNKKNNDINENYYLKEIRHGLISKVKGAAEHYFLMMMIFLSFAKDKEIEVVPFLVERWNAKNIAIHNYCKKNEGANIKEEELKQENLQNNITNVFIRIIKNLEDISTGLNFKESPYEVDDRLHIKFDDDFYSRAPLFNDVYKLLDEYKSEYKKER